MGRTKIFPRGFFVGLFFTIVFSIVTAAGVYSYHVNQMGRMQNQLGNAKLAVIAMEESKAMTEVEVEKLKHEIVNLQLREQQLMEQIVFSYIKSIRRNAPNMIVRAIARESVRVSKKYNMPIELLMGIMEVESRFNPEAVSSAGARGLMQVMPFWVKKIDFVSSKYDFHNIGQGIEAGAVAFRVHLEEANNNMARGLYYYVGKDHSYKWKVYRAMGEFMAYRTSFDPDKLDPNLRAAFEKSAAPLG